MAHIIYYISGHGYGHATRSLEVIRTVLRDRSDFFFHVRTNAPSWIVELNLASNFDLHNCSLDVGAVQQTSFKVDKPATLQAVRRLLSMRAEIIDRERKFAQGVGAKLIVSDIPFIAFDIAAGMSIPGIGVANFSWDWIYGDFAVELPEFTDAIDEIRESYAKTTRLLRLPLHGDFSAFPAIRDIPFIARRAERSAAETRELLGLEQRSGKKAVLIALRPSDLAGVNLQALSAVPNVVFVTLGLQRALPNGINIAPDLVRFPELVNACDLVVSKPGYGLVTDIIANRTPLLYVARDDFIECGVLEDGLQRHAVAKSLPRADFLSGAWMGFMQELLEVRQDLWPEVAIDGAQVAAQEIIDLAGE